MKILYNFASRSRPERFFSTLDNVINLSTSPDFAFLIKIDSDDETMMAEIPRLEWYCEMFEMVVCVGVSKSKVNAINRDIPDTGWDCLINLSDDMSFLYHGFDTHIKSMLAHDMFLHLPDNYAGDRVCTMSIMDNAYYQRDKFIYNPAYYSLWCDNEATEIAKIRGCYNFQDMSLVQHDHYSNGRTHKDWLYRRNDTYHQDKLIFEERKANNFYL